MLSIRALLGRNREFRRLFLATVVSLAGDWFSFVAVAGLVTELTGSAGAPAFIYAATVLPVFLASPIAGAVADRFDRKRILIIANLVRVPIALLLCAAAWWSSVPLAVCAIIALGIGAAFFDPISSAATPNLVDETELASAQSLMGAVWGSMLMVGAGIGGIIAEVFGRQTAFVIDALSFVVSAWLIAGIRRPMQQAAPATREHPRFRDLVGYLRTNSIVCRLMFGKTGVSSANGIVGLLPAFAVHRYAGSISTGLLFVARGFGALVGPILARSLIGATPSRRAIVLLCGGSTLMYAAAYSIFPLVVWFPLALVLVVIAHFGGGAQWSMSTYALQSETPDHIRGRIMALDYGLATLCIGSSSIVAGLLANAYGEATTTHWLALVAAVHAIAWMAWSLPATR